MNELQQGDVWATERFGSSMTMLVIGHEAVSRVRPGVLCVPISGEVLDPKIFQPIVHDMAGKTLGTAMLSALGEVNKNELKTQLGTLAPRSWEAVKAGLQAVLGL